jgi:hypothetical protein
MSAYRRLQQGLCALASGLRPVRDADAQQVLSPPMYALFLRMRRSERQHSLRVYHDLIAAGHTHPDLLIAALLHDVGKTRTRFWLPEKVLVVLVKVTVPRLYLRWGQGAAQGWRRPFATSVQHPAWGAEMVATGGGSPMAVALIRQHAEALQKAPQNTTERLLMVLQQYDDLN